MTLHFNLVVQTHQFYFLPRIRIHFPSFKDDFYVFAITWTIFHFILASQELLSMATSWREIVKVIVDNDPDTMMKLDSLVRKTSNYTEEQFAHKAKFIVNGFI